MPTGNTPPPPRVVGVILAGGLGKRMGGVDKPFVMLAGRSMFDRALRRFSPQVGQVLISANDEQARFRMYAIPVISDLNSNHRGPLAGILAGMRWTAKHRLDIRSVVSIAADTPFFPGHFVRALTERCRENNDPIALAASEERIQPVFGLWPVSLADDLEEFLHSCSGGGVRR